MWTGTPGRRPSRWSSAVGMSAPSWRLTSSSAAGPGGGAQLLHCARERAGGGDSAVRNNSLLQPNGLSHPACLVALNSGHNLALLRPFVSPRCSPGTDQVMGPDVNDCLIQQVASPTASPVRSVQTIAQLLLVAGG